MGFSTFDREMMSRALKLAARGRFTTTPNPNVGCVIVVDGDIVGEGWHRVAGQPHAEVNALQAAGDKARGATAYVTLEPCCHQGKTGPCADALIDAGIERVVIGCEDPNPKVCGCGAEKLRKAGITVELPLLEEQARTVNRGFFRRQEQGLPWVLVKMASSFDARTAMASGQSQWVTTPASRQDVQRLRAASCAIITGSGTQQMDDPSLTVRISSEELGINEDVRQPLRVVVDSTLQVSPEARMLSQPGQTLVATLAHNQTNRNVQTLSDAGAEVVFLPERNGHIDLLALLKFLAERGCNQVMVEAGAVLAGNFVAEGLFDELVCYIAPKLFGSDARPMFDLPIQTIDAHLALSVQDIRRIGEDIRVTLYPDKDY